MKKNVKTIIAEMANANAFNLGIFNFNKGDIAGTYHGNPLFEGKTYTNEQIIIDNIEDYLWECKTRWYREHRDTAYDMIKAEVEKAIAWNTESMANNFDFAIAHNLDYASNGNKSIRTYAQHIGFKLAD